MTTQTPAGWYPDPYGEPQLRWWDGDQWTDATHAQEQPSGGPRQPASGPQPQPQPQPQPPQPQSDPDWSATPANPTLQFGQPTHGQSAYGQPVPPTQWSGTPGPGYGPPPKQGNPLPWVFGGLAALVVVALIVVAGIFFVNRGSGTDTALPPVPSDRLEPEQPPANPLPSNEPPPGQGAPELPQPADGRITDPRAGVSFEVPEDWQVPPSEQINGQDPMSQKWSAAVQAMSHEDYEQDQDWVGNVYTGVLSALYPYNGVSSMGDTAKALFVDFSGRFYAPAHESKVVSDKAFKIGDKDAWVLQFELDFTKISEEKGFKWKKENGALVLIDRGSGESPGILYVSVPDNLGTDVVGKVLSSLKPA
ncbi:DUF2510 domain-containing protein [Nonomuraea sp. NPDC046802]|uniref:DUF2510 domain-containing protein n=1 Tax=Nonomuraea sp. NPDC046802 TaxID=3154919 RepID=UPI0033EE715B